MAAPKKPPSTRNAGSAAFLVLGMHRWVLRVGAYVSLMTDAYPPFRLDTGGTDPATTVIAPIAPKTAG